VGQVDVGAPFYRVRGGAGRSGAGEERAVVVVRHNGDEGGCFRRGSAELVVGSDERGSSDRYGSGSGARRRRVRTGGGGSGGRPGE
jgi:hypothetical protein